MHTRLVLPVIVLTLLLPVCGQSQSLADVAKAEEARRKTIKGTAKTYTNDNLVRSDGSAPPAATGTAGTATTPAATPATPAAGTTKPDAATDARDEQYWRKRIETARDSINRNKVLISALESRVNALNTDFVNMDDPAQRSVIQENLKTATAELARVKQDIDKGTKAITDIQEEARKANVPPGWLR